MSTQYDLLSDVYEGAPLVAMNTKLFILSADKKTVLATAFYYQGERGELCAKTFAPADYLHHDTFSLQPNAGLYPQLASLLNAERVITEEKSKVMRLVSELYCVNDRIAGISWLVGFDDTTPQYEPGRVYLPQDGNMSGSHVNAELPLRFPNVDTFWSYLSSKGTFAVVDDPGALSSERVYSMLFRNIDLVVLNEGEMSRCRW